VFGSIDDLDDLWRPARVVEPSAGTDREGARERWRDAVSRSAGWIPELSSLDF
jgi:hypothetical protein